jgi:4-cresol dehydrogenase (hydroxylating)
MVAVASQLHAMGVGTASAIFSPLHEALAASGREPSSGDASEFERLTAEFNRDLFLSSFSSQGPEKVVRAQIEVAQERIAAAVPGVRINVSPLARVPADHASATETDRALIGKPGLLRFWEDTTRYDWDGHLWFSPLLPQSGAEIRKAYQVFGDICRRTGVFFGLPDVLLYNSTAMGPASTCYCLVKNFNVSKTDKEYNRRTLATVKELIHAAGENGWSEYRGAPALQQAIMDQLSFNDHAYMKLCESIKDAIDPNGILSAGRYGIWPKHLRPSAAGDKKAAT